MAKRQYKLKDIAIYVLVVATSFIVRQLPRSASLRLGAWLGDIVDRTVKRRRQIALKNLSMALGSEKSNDELKHIARSSFRNMGKTLVEFLSTPRYSAERLQAMARVEGMENIQQAMARDKGVIVISAHLGNWELIFPVMSRANVYLSAVVQSFRYRGLDRLVNSYRTRHGGQVIKKEMAVKQSLRLLRQGQVVAFLGDQDAGDNGVFIDFFGIPASTPRGPIMLALRTDASIVNILDIRQEDDRHVITISEPMELEISGDLEKDVEINTAKFVKYLEKKVREHPCQWLWMHNRWKTRPKPIKDSPVSSIQHPASSIKHPVSSIQYQASSIKHQASSIQYPVSSILILSDGKPGHYNQSLGIMDRMRDVSVKTIQLKFRRKWRDDLLRVSARILGGVKLPRDLIKAMLQWAMESSSAAEMLGAGYFDAILSTGSSVAAPNLLLGQLTGAKTAVCTRPSPVGINHFDLAILPAHTRSRRHTESEVDTLGVPNRITPEYVNTAGTHLARKLETDKQLRIIGLLLGGDDRHYSVPPGMVSKLCDILLGVCREIDAYIVLTTSRRTAPGSEDVIKEKVLGNPLCCLAILASEPSRQGNPVPGILGVSEVTIVTEDSFSMVCEAASSGKKIIILEVKRNKQGHLRRQKVYQLLTERGYTKTANISNLKSVLMDSVAETETPRALDDAQTAADALRELISRG